MEALLINSAATNAPDLQIEKLSAANAEAIPDFVYRIFGYSYTHAWLYEPQQIRNFIEEDSQAGFVCVGGNGSVKALLLLTYSFPSREMLEIAELLVDPDVGQLGGGYVLKQFIDALQAELWHRADNCGLRTVMSLEVTEHQLTQRLSHHMGFFTAGVYLGYIPGWQRQLRTTPEQRLAGGKSLHTAGVEGGRRTMVVSARPFRSKTPPQRLTLPSRFEKLVRKIYKEFRLAHEFIRPQRRPGAGQFESSLDFIRGRAVIEVREVGESTPDILLERLQHFRNGFIDLVHFVLPLSGDDIDCTVDRLSEAGCVFGAVLPQYRDCPVFVMQSVNRAALAPIPSGVLSPRAAEILANILPK
jgi:hypothetical protein